MRFVNTVREEFAGFRKALAASSAIDLTFRTADVRRGKHVPKIANSAVQEIPRGVGQLSKLMRRDVPSKPLCGAKTFIRGSVRCTFWQSIVRRLCSEQWPDTGRLHPHAKRSRPRAHIGAQSNARESCARVHRRPEYHSSHRLLPACRTIRTVNASIPAVKTSKCSCQELHEECRLPRVPSAQMTIL